MLESFPNPHPDAPYTVTMVCPEFTCVCPVTGQPDFATMTISYDPGPRCVELKSLKLYLWGYRDQGAYHEDVTNRIANDLAALLEPVSLTVTALFNVRGGITTTVVARR